MHLHGLHIIQHGWRTSEGSIKMMQILSGMHIEHALGIVTSMAAETSEGSMNMMLRHTKHARGI